MLNNSMYQQQNYAPSQNIGTYNEENSLYLPKISDKQSYNQHQQNFDISQQQYQGNSGNNFYLQEMYALQNDRIGNANSSFNSLKSRFMSQRLSHQVNQSVQLNTHEISALKRIVRKNHQKQYNEDQQQLLNKSQIGFSSRQNSNMRQAENSLIISKKELRKQQFHSRAESQILQDRQTLNNTSINNHFNTSYLQGKNIQTTKNQNTPLKNEFRIKTSQTKSRSKQLRTPSVNKQLGVDHRISMNEFKVPFHIYQQESNNLTQVNSPSNNNFISKSLLKSRQKMKRGNSQNDIKFNSITKSKQFSPRLQDKSRSRERSIKSSLSNRSMKTKIYSQNLANKTSIQDKSHQPKLKKLRMAALKEFQYNSNQTDRFNNQYMKIIEEQQVSNFDNSTAVNRIKLSSQRGAKKQKLKPHNIENLINNTSLQHPQTVKNANQQNNLLSLINNQSKTQNIPVQNEKVKSLSPKSSQQYNIQSLANQIQQQQQQPIVSYKKLFEEVNSENIQLRSQMQHMLEDQTKKQTQINKIKIKTAQAQSDKIELMRDLATYESNFSDNCGVRSILLQIHKKIQLVKQNVESEKRFNKGKEQISQFKADKKQQQIEDKDSESWLDDKQKNIIFKHLSELSILKRERGSVSDAMQSDIFLNSGNLQQASPIKGALGVQNQIFFNKNKKNQITPRDDQKGIYEEQLYQSTQISGIPCTIQANLLNGMVQVIVQTNIDHKQHKLEIKPLNNKIKISLKREIQRLQFVLEKKQTKKQNNAIAQLPWADKNQDKNNNKKQKLVLKACESYDEDQTLQQIVRIQGCLQMFCEAKIIPSLDKQENQDVIVKVKHSQQETQITIKSIEEEFSNQKVFEILQENYIFRDLKNNQQELVNISECQVQHIKTTKWLKKIQNDQSLSEKTLEYTQLKNINQQQNIKQQIKSDSDDSNDQIETPGGRNKQYMLNLNQSPVDESPDFNNQSRAVLDVINQKKQSINQILMNHNNDEVFLDESSVSEHDNDNVVFSPTKADDQQIIKINVIENMDETMNNNQDGIYELNQELQDMMNYKQQQNKHSQDLKRIKSYDQVDQDQEINQLDALQLKCIKSQSNSNLNLVNNLLSLQQNSPDGKKTSSKQTVNMVNNNQEEQIVEYTQEEKQLQLYEFLYHYKWYANNRQYYQVAKARQEELDRLKRLEEEEKERLRKLQEKEHDDIQLYVILQSLEKYRDFFKGPQSIAFMKQPLLHQDEFDFDEKTKITVFIYPIIYEDKTQDLNFLINKYTHGEREIVSSRRSSGMRANSFESIIINKDFLESLGLLQFKNVDLVQKQLQEFLNNQAFQCIVKHHLTQLIIEKTLQSKTFEQHHQPMSQLQVNPGIRKMDSEFKNTNTLKDNNTANSITVTVRGYEKTSSDFGDTSMNDSYSKYLK